MFKVFGFYKFVKIKSLKKNKDFLQKFLISNHIRGTIIIAKEGLNGTISGSVKDIDKTTKKLNLYSHLNYLIVAMNLNLNFNHFINLKLRLKKKLYQ